MRRLRKMILVSVPVIGTATVFLATVLISDSNVQARIFMVAVGVLVIHVGVWKIPHALLPGGRTYSALREEVDRFILLVRSLNEAALKARDADTDESWLRVRVAAQAMHDSVDQMTELAGKASTDVRAATTTTEKA